MVIHLPRINLDHRPLFLKVSLNNVMRPKERPFRYQSAWMLYGDFKWVLYESWEGKDHYLKAVMKFSNAISEWNKNIFGSLDKRKKHLFARLAGIQRALEFHRSQNLLELELELKRELDMVLT